MRIAIGTGFHSLVEVLLQNGVPADGSALSAALLRRREDIVHLLFQCGADPRSVSLEEVIYTGSQKRKIIEAAQDRPSDCIYSDFTREIPAPSDRCIDPSWSRLPDL